MTNPTPQPPARDYSWRRTHDALPDISLIVWISAGGGTALLACHTGSEWVSATNDRPLPFVPIYWQHLRLPEWPDQPPAPTPNVSETTIICGGCGSPSSGCTCKPVEDSPLTNVSETPRTDTALVDSILCTEGGDEECTVYPCVEHVESDFARQLERELTAALARAEKAEGDTRRLDWLEQQFGLAIWRGVMIDDNKPVFDIHEPREEGWDDALGEELGSGRTLRAAIDAALTPTKEPAP